MLNDTSFRFTFILQPMIPPNQLNTSPQNIPAQVLQKQQQMRSMHPNMMAQQQQQQQHIINTSNVHQVEFRQPISANIVLPQNQMQQFQPVCGNETKSIRHFAKNTIETKALLNSLFRTCSPSSSHLSK